MKNGYTSTVSGLFRHCTLELTSYSHYAAYIDIAGKKQSALYSYALLS